MPGRMAVRPTSWLTRWLVVGRRQCARATSSLGIRWTDASRNIGHVGTSIKVLAGPGGVSAPPGPPISYTRSLHRTFSIANTCRVFP